MKRNLLGLATAGMILLGSIASFASERVTEDNFVRAETDMTFARYAKQGAFGTSPQALVESLDLEKIAKDYGA